LAFRHHLWRLGFKIAEAMDTAQRGMGLDWVSAQELIRRVLGDARHVAGADLACGAGTDHLAPGEAKSLDDVIAAYESQVEFIEAQGGRVILMASRALAALARSPDDFFKVYDRVLSGCRDKVILHWLGDMFDPALAGYWGASDVAGAMDACLAIIDAHAGKIDGVKISLLEARLLGIFDPIAPAAAAALQRLGAGDRAGYDSILAPTLVLSRKLFEAPTQYYKAGIVFLAWLNGFQDHFAMVGGMQSARSILHYADLFRFAHEAGLMIDPEQASVRMAQLCAVNGIG